MNTLPICQNCGAEWSWAETLKIGFKGSKRCDTCGTRQYVTQNFSLKIYVLLFLPLLTLIVFNSFLEFPMPVFITLSVLHILSMLSILPYTIKLSNEQKPLW